MTDRKIGDRKSKYKERKMSDDPSLYDNPLIARYASRQMGRLWGPQRKFSTWRRLWVALAEAEAELGLPITPEQINQLRAHVDDIDFAAAERHERRLRHDVMAHVHAYAEQCPAARPIIHLGATSCYVTDNTDLILLREALALVRDRLVAVIDQLGRFARRHRDLACLAFTHLQPAQPTTVGKRACLWAYDLVLDLEEIEHRMENLSRWVQRHHRHAGQLPRTVPRRSRQGPSAGIANRREDRLRRQLRRHRADLSAEDRLAGAGRCCPASPKARTRWPPTCGSSSIARKLKSLSRTSRWVLRRWPTSGTPCGASGSARWRGFVISLESSAAMTAATQWFERTLDDSANRRLVLPQSFLAADALLMLAQNVARGLVVYPRVVAKGLAAELPFMATENVLMAAVAAGGDRQELHEWNPPSQSGGRGGGQGGRQGERSLGPPGGRSGVCGSRSWKGPRSGPVCGPCPGAGQRVPGQRRRADPEEISAGAGAERGGKRLVVSGQW